MAALKTRLEALEAMAPNNAFLPCRVLLMAHTDPRTADAAPVGGHPSTVTRIVLTPLTRRPIYPQGAVNGNA